MSVESTITRANSEIDSGRLWRAKEILGSSIRNHGYSTALFAAYADVLLRTGNRVEAGKYFLLSRDVPAGDELAAIELFLHRYGRLDYRQLIGCFPACARVSKTVVYPDFLRSHLDSMGAPETVFEVSQSVSTPVSNSMQDRIFLIGCSLICFAVLACLIVGFREIVSWFF